MVFKEAEKEALFQKNGFIVLPLISKVEAEELLRFYLMNPNKKAKNFHVTHFSEDSNYKKDVHNKIVDTFAKSLKEILYEYTLLLGNFMVKETGKDSILPLHADWTFVDEQKYQSIGIWCPLVDTNKTNGWLGVVPFSHELKVNKRGNGLSTPFFDFNNYITKKYGKYLRVNAGEAVIFDHRLLHFSAPNVSDDIRVALNIAAVPKDASILHYAVFNNSTQVQQFDVSGSDFFFEYDHLDGPNKKNLVKTFELHVVPYTKSYLNGILDKRSLTERIKSFFLNEYSA